LRIGINDRKGERVAGRLCCVLVELTEWAREWLDCVTECRNC